MEKSKSKVSYSIIRFSPDDIRGEVINIGALLYDYENKTAKMYLLDENSNKIKSITENKMELDLYKSYKDSLEYYIANCKNDLAGYVGEYNIASFYDSEFLYKMFEEYENKKLTLSKPNIAFTKDEDQLFKLILNRYIGEKHIYKEPSSVTARNEMKQLFENQNLLNKKVKMDVVVNPIERLEDLKVKADFGFKNGVWNYIQALPSIISPNKNTEWFGKTQLILSVERNNNARIHLLYKESDIKNDKSTWNLMDYLTVTNSRVKMLNVEKKKDVNDLCKYITEYAEPIESLAV